MEFMGTNFNRGIRGAWPGRFTGFPQLYIAASLRTVLHHGVSGYGAHHITPGAFPAETATEVHQSSALCINRQAGFDRLTNVRPQTVGGFPGLHVPVGKGPPDGPRSPF